MLVKGGPDLKIEYQDNDRSNDRLSDAAYFVIHCNASNDRKGDTPYHHEEIPITSHYTIPALFRLIR